MPSIASSSAVPDRPAPGKTPAGAGTARCRYCGKTIVFRETLNGRLQPMDIDPATGEVLEVHFGTCPARQEARRQRRLAEGKPPAVPTDRCHLPSCGGPALRYLPPKGVGGSGHLWAARCLRCGIHRFLPRTFDPPAGALPPAAPTTSPPRAVRPWSRPEHDWEWAWQPAGWAWYRRHLGVPSAASSAPGGAWR